MYSALLPSPEEVFRTALEGCLKKRRIHFTYYSPAKDERTTRTVDPYHLFNYMGTWHLIGYCHLRGFVRDFVLGRITGAKVLEEKFEKSADFDVKHYFHSSFGIYKGAAKQEVMLRFSPEKSRWVKSQIWHRDQKTRLLKGGSLELSFPVSDFSEIKMQILRRGDQAKVIGPNA